jgi:hypothetical protein
MIQHLKLRGWVLKKNNFQPLSWMSAWFFVCGNPLTPLSLCLWQPTYPVKSLIVGGLSTAIGCKMQCKLPKHNEITTCWKALEEYFLMVPLFLSLSKTFGHDHSLESTRGVRSDGTINFMIEMFTSERGISKTPTSSKV